MFRVLKNMIFSPCFCKEKKKLTFLEKYFWIVLSSKSSVGAAKTNEVPFLSIYCSWANQNVAPPAARLCELYDGCDVCSVIRRGVL